MEMKVQSSKQELTREHSIRVHVTFPVAELQTAIETLAKDYAMKARMPGFRPGKVPVSLIRERYKDSLRAEALEKTLPIAIEQAVKQEDIVPYGPPKLDEGEAGEELFSKKELPDPIKFSVTFALAPEATLKSPTSVVLRDHTFRVEEGDIEEMLEQKLLPYMSFTEVTGKPAYKDILRADIIFEDKTLSGENLKDHLFVYHGEEGGAIPEYLNGLRQLIMEMSVGETRSATVIFPEETKSEPAAAQNTPPRTASAKVTIKGIRRQSRPKFDKELQDKLQIESEAAYREKIRLELTEAGDKMLRHAHIREVLKENMKTSTFRIPEVAIKNYIERVWEETQKEMRAYYEKQGMRGKELEQNVPSAPEDSWLKENRERAEREIREMLIANELEKKFPQEEVSADSLNTRLKEIARQMQRGEDEESIAALRKELETAGYLSRLEDDLKRDAVWDAVLSACRHKKGQEYALKEFQKEFAPSQ